MIQVQQSINPSGSQVRGDQRVQVREAVHPVHQHADERHDVPARRVDGHAQEDPRGPGGDGRQAEVEPADSGQLVATIFLAKCPTQIEV